MKINTAYKVFLYALCIAVLSWFLPWLYSIAFPVSPADPFVAFSPVSGTFVVSDNSTGSIFGADAQGRPTGHAYTKEERDSLVPQIYFNQLVANDRMPDSIQGMEVSVPILKQNQWVFNSLPRDINKVQPRVYMIMESMPARYELEDPKEVFRMDADAAAVEFIDIRTNTVNARRSRRFTELLAQRGFRFPMKAFSANVTTRKPYDEGYLMIDAEGTLYHMKMQAGRPYMVKVQTPDSIKAAHAFIMENPETRHLGLVTDTHRRLYVLEHEGYRLIPLPTGPVDPERQKISVVKNLFNWVIKVSDARGARWIALDSRTYRHLGTYTVEYPLTATERVAGYIFPFALTFTSVEDCHAYPRIEPGTWHALLLGALLACIIAVMHRRRRGRRQLIAEAALTLIFGIYAFIPLALIK
ncbi:MAG: DUF4857 domain-containing protein [bacterium]|nr:DUF4857 domain-containing protein [bacterium]